jgi:hypothetical protein
MKNRRIVGYESAPLPEVVRYPSSCISMCFALQVISRDQRRRLTQFWTLSPGTRLNSRSLLVTRVSPADLA